MAEQIEIRVPDIGDFEGVEVVDVLVSEGDQVEVEAPLLTLETDKASMDIPSTVAGRLVRLAVSNGDRISQGDLVAVVEAEADAQSANPGAAPIEQAVETPGGVAGGGADGQPAEVRVPDIGDFSDVDVIDVHVAAGDTVKFDDPLITLETDKASMDVPSTIEGVIREIVVSSGDKVSEGDLIARLDPTVPLSSVAPEARPAPGEGDTPAPPDSVTASPAASKEPSPQQRPAIDEKTFAQAHAGPSVRRFARELGVDLGLVNGSGRKGRITGDDVKEFVKSVMASHGDGQVAPVVSALPEVPEVDFSRFGDIDVQPLSRIQKISGPRLHASWVNLPHVTQFDEADTTALEARRQKLKEKAAKQGARLTPLAFLVVACVHALQEFPRFNSSLDPAGENLVFKKYFHIGFAADTPNGLVVPVIRDADKKTLLEIARDLATLSGKARDGKLGPTDMQGGCFTISSLGSLGGTAFTPIINAPEVAILGVSRSIMKPVWQGESFEPRLMLPVSLSYDHRVIDGAEAVRFTRFLAEQLEDPDGLMLA